MDFKFIISIAVLIVLVGFAIYNMYKAELSPKNIILVGLFAALTAIGAYITIPLPIVPITMQIFFSLISGIILGSRLGMLSQMIYVIIGLIGMPVFSGGAGGIHYVFSPTFGYLVGFIFAGYIGGKIMELRGKSNFAWVLISSLAALAVVYVLGVAYLYVAKNLFLGVDFPFTQAIYWGFLVTIVKDLFTCVIVAVIGVHVRKALRKSNLI